ncbi:hypothetical protein LGQ02_15730 [Bacillus shivajii]|uniref:hypothetical protein n=1 Tax=Bacillus shivajii TaxID=1983719 RepID=UPI001CF9CE24|nr:hypothetical protein [Bacillus shivajii]UCZ52281.1 hypothetical protein LGQ02_15730 [Bacillus shivajii]
MKKDEKRRNNEIEKIDIPEIEHETPHPGTKEYSLQDTKYSPGENEYLNEYTGTDKS